MLIFLIIPSLLACNPASRLGIESFLKTHDGRPCFEWSAFTCATLKIPMNHLAPDNGQSIEVTFAVLPAANPDLRKGIFVVATGGPGSSGILSADYYITGYDQAILDHFDIVFFDQRGMGLSGGLACPEAAMAYYQPGYLPIVDPAENHKQIARAFSENCVQEMTNPELLPYLGTAQAIEDLEFFRRLIGDDKIWLYGESYGTQFAQQYAEKYPAHVAGMILDGTVDLTLTGLEFYQQQAQGFNDTLTAVFDACEADPFCHQDISSVNPAGSGNNAIRAYDSLLAQLESSPVRFSFPLPGGGFEDRQLTFSDLEFTAASQLYGEGDRMMLVRALLKYARDADPVPLARLLYIQLSLNPQNLASIPDASYSDAVYYGVECQDYGYPGTSPEEKADAYIAEGNLISLPRFHSVLYGDLPCAYWPDANPDPSRPTPSRADGIPVLVLGATADPVTPAGNGTNVFQHLSDGYLITTNGGPHVTYGYGNPCPDALVTDFLVRGSRPSSRSITCDGRMMDSYVPLAPEHADLFASLSEALASFEMELDYLPEYYYWSEYEPLRAGCPQGGTLQTESTDKGIAISLSGCSFSTGFQLTGTGLYDSGNDTFAMNVITSGNWVCDRLEYVRTAETIRIDGSCNGQPLQTQTIQVFHDQWKVWKQQHPLLTTQGSTDTP